MTLMQDFRYAARLLRQQLRYTLLTVFTLAIGIAATTTLFSVSYGVLMKPLPWPNAERVVVLTETRGGNAPRFGAFTNTAYLAWREQARTMDDIAAWTSRVVTLSGAGEPERIRIAEATASLFSVLHVRSLVGTTFEEKDETSHVVVLSESLWRDRFSGDRAVTGRLVELDGRPYTVVGVLPEALAFPDRQIRAVVPLSVPPAAGNSLSMFNAIGAFRPGITPAQAAAEGTARARFAADTGMTTTAIFGNNGPVEIAAQPLGDSMTSEVRRPLIVLLVAVGLLFLTAIANVANLQLARTTTRRREIGIRVALGAGAARVTRQLLVETLLTGMIGGGAGLALTWLLHRAMPSLLPADFPRIGDLGVDMTVVTFALVVTIGTSTLVGLLPALQVRRLNIVDALVEDGSAVVGASARSRTAGARTLVMTTQIAIACMLLIAASLLGRSFLALVSADRGFDSSAVLSARLSMPLTTYPAPERRFAIVEHILHRLEAVPGVRDAAFTSELPLTPGGSTAAFDLKSPDAPGGVVQVQASPRIVSPRYFAAVGMHWRAGRAFTDQDTESSQPVVIVNDSFARRYLGRAPLGAKIPMVAYGPPDGAPLESTVIGIVEDVRYVNAVSDSQPELYYSHRQMAGRLPLQTVTLMMRTSGDFGGAAAALRSVVREADARLVAEAVMPLQQRLLTALARPRLYALLLGSFAAFALLIAAVGLFGMLSYAVSQRSRELAIRAALGARPGDLLRLVLRQGLSVSCAGLAIGMLASVWVMRLLSTQLYGVTPHDTTTFVIVPALLLVCGALACAMPARRAARLDPLRVLRGDARV